MKPTSHNLFLYVAALALAITLFVAGGGSVSAQSPLWTAEFFNNTTLSGTPVYSSTVPKIDNYWGYDSPVPGVVSSDYWSARFTQQYFAPAGNYRITARMDDGMRIYFDGQLIVNEWYDSQEHAVSKDFYVSTTGYHTVVVEYYDKTGVGMAVVKWEPIAAGGGGATYPNWKAEYFTNTTLSGTPQVVRDEAKLDLNWGYNSPAPGSIPEDNWSARFTRTLNIPAGQYRISLTNDDGARLYINDAMIIDGWKFTGAPMSVDYFHDGKPARVRVEYVEKSGKARLVANYILISDDVVVGGGGGGGGTNDQCPRPGTYQAVFQVNSVVKNGPGKDYATVTAVDRCTILTLSGEKSPDGRWVSVRRDGPGGISGWADATVLALGTSLDQLNPNNSFGSGTTGGSGTNGSTNNMVTGPSGVVCGPMPGSYQAVALTNLNIRSGAGTTNALLTTVPQCSKLTLTGFRDGNWVSVAVPGSTSGQVGWVDAQYLVLGTPIDSLNAVSPVITGAVG